MLRKLSNSFFLSRCARTLPGTALALFLTISAFPQDHTHRLILKDGSYQQVTQYEVKGDRVRYYSSEREEWEELPTSLVDWPATDKFEKERPAAPEAVQLDKELEKESELEESRLPQVAPGLRLPEDSGVFLLDTFHGEPQIVELQQTAGDVNRNTKGNILKGAINPIAGVKQTIELEGAHAAVQSHVDVPALYINIDAVAAPLDQAGAQTNSNPSPQSPQQPQQPIVAFDRFRIVHADVKGGKRIIGEVKRQVTGKVSEEQRFVKTTITNLSGGWLKLTPTENLTPGEYALVEVMDKQMNLYVWDFGVNPQAPANANPWRPDTKAASPPPPKADQ